MVAAASLAVLASAVIAAAGEVAGEVAVLPAVGKPPPQEVGGDVVDLYEESIATLERTCDDYRRIRAIRLAQIRDMPFEEAHRNVDSVMPIFDPVDKNLLRQKIRDPADIQTHKQEVLTVERDVEVMIDLTAKLLLEIERIQAEMMEADASAFELTLEEIVQKPQFDPDAEVDQGEVRRTQEQNAALAEAAREEEGQRFKDLTALMRQAAEEERPQEERQDGQRQVSPDGRPDIKDLTRETAEKGKAALPLFRQHDDHGRLAGLPNLEDAEYVFGRKIVEDGRPAEWMFLDTWYIIGPFPNPFRANLDRKFPPETVIDLDATYTGKDGREVRWVFHQEGSWTVLPPQGEEYAIFYAFTEVYVERPMDLWVAIGSDDKGHVWLNDQPIWISGDRLKGWRVDEGFRKVHFRRGVNRVLYRIENGWLQVSFSLGICTQ